ncbi:hypothetical protein MBLNU230_g2943t1 [Neophaeotheca triangularis]
MPPSSSMYHTFAVESTPAKVQVESPDQRRISTSIACVECRRKKIRCGGGKPCQHCSSAKRSELCKYPKQARKAVVSRSQVEKLQDTVDQHSTVVSRLFPGHQLADLVLLDRCQLLQLAASTQEEQPETSASPARETTGQHVQDSTSPSVSHLETAQSLATLDHVPELNPAADEVTRYRSTVHAVSDDVNGLSFSVDKASSYVGISSVNAVLKAIFKIAPQLQSQLAQHCPRTTQPSRAPSPSAPPSPQPTNTKEIMPSPPPDVAEKHIDAYFEHIHALVPMIDEDAFRFSFLYEERVDAPWLALFNVVLAMGSLASGTCDSVEHSTYARRARQILRQRSLGSNNLLVLQAHGLLSGYYLHWLNRPNEANAMMGATMRIASAIGIHREYEISCLAHNTPIPSEVRRRTWWCLVCLDTWASMTTGRPSFGRLGPGITVKRPTLPPTTNNKQYLASLKLLPLVHNIEFCTLATHVQDQLATKPMLSSEELAIQDAKLVDWHESLPPILRCVSPPFRSAQGPQHQATTKRDSIESSLAILTCGPHLGLARFDGSLKAGFTAIAKPGFTTPKKTSELKTAGNANNPKTQGMVPSTPLETAQRRAAVRERFNTDDTDDTFAA